MRSKSPQAPGVAENFSQRNRANSEHYGIRTLSGAVAALGGTAMSAGVLAVSQVEGLSGSPATLWAAGGGCVAATLHGVRQMVRGARFGTYLERETELIETMLENRPPLSPDGIQQGLENIQERVDILDKRRLAYARRIHHSNIDLPGEEGVRHILLHELLRYGHPHSGGELFNAPAACVIGWTGVARPDRTRSKRDPVLEVVRRREGSLVTPRHVHEHFVDVLDELVPLQNGVAWGGYYDSKKYQDFAGAAWEIACARRAMWGLLRRRSGCLRPFERR